jgi:hypothetical protein
MFYRTSSTSHNSHLTPSSTGNDPDGWRQWWAVESARAGSNWRSIFELHCEIIDRLRSSALWASSS